MKFVIHLTMTAIASLAGAVTSVAAQDSIDMTGLDPVFAERPYSPYADRAFPENVYFGDTHVHTGLSGDAGGGGTRLMPRDAYRFARGEQVTSNTGQPVKLRTPFDFFMITDHSDAMGRSPISFRVPPTSWSILTASGSMKSSMPEASVHRTPQWN